MASSSRRRMVYLGTIVAIIAMCAGYVVASVLAPTLVTQSASFYQGGNGGANGYSAATLAVTTTPAATSACTTGTITGSSSGGTVTLILSSTTGGTTCTTGDFAEEFSVSFSASITSQTNTFTITTEVSGGTVQTNSEPVTLQSVSSGLFTQTVDVYVDYGAVNPPDGGITVLDLVIQ